MHAYIFNIQGFSIHDGPGIRTTVFFQGCPLQCLWCHNPEGMPAYLHSREATASRHGIRKYALGELLDELLKDKLFYDESGGGVTFSGGEPLMQSEFLLCIMKQLHKEGVHCVVDTSGYAPREVFRPVVDQADLILFDLKLADAGQHQLYTGTSNDIIHRNLELLDSSDTPYRIRIPLVSEITASNENLEGILSLLSGKDPEEVNLLSYHDLGKGKHHPDHSKKELKTELTAPGGERLGEIMDKFQQQGYSVSLGG